MRTRLALCAAFAVAVGGCTVDSVALGDRCELEGDRLCRTDQLSFYCEQGHWFEKNCYAVCRSMAYEAGWCGPHSRFGDGVCFCEVAHRLLPGLACHHEGDQACRYETSADRVLFACVDGVVREIDCGAACGGVGACGYDPQRGDDTCICPD